MSLLGLKQLVFQLSHLNITLIVQLVDAIVVDDLQPIQFTDGRVLLVPDHVDVLTQSLVFDEVAIVVADVRVKLDLQLGHLNLGLLALGTHRFAFLSLLFALGDQRAVVLLALHLGLINLPRVVLVLLLRLLFEILPLLQHLVELLLEALVFDAETLLLVQGIAQLDLQLSDLVIARINYSFLFFSESFNKTVITFLSVFALVFEGVL